MCISQAGPVVEMLPGGEALVEVAGRRRPVSLAPLVLAGVEVQVGDWVILHTGIALETVDPELGRDLMDDVLAATMPDRHRLGNHRDQEES